MQDQKTVENPYASKKSAYYALVLLTIVYSFNFIDRQLLAILQESVKADLDLSDSQLGLLTGFAFTRIPGGFVPIEDQGYAIGFAMAALKSVSFTKRAARTSPRQPPPSQWWKRCCWTSAA